jgi:hypothetical protein
MRLGSALCLLAAAMLVLGVLTPLAAVMAAGPVRAGSRGRWWCCRWRC